MSLSAVALELGGTLVADFSAPADPSQLFETPYGDHPPLEWAVEVPQGLTVNSDPYISSEGRVAMVAWDYHACHNADPLNTGECWIPEPSPTGNRRFQQGATIFANGGSGVSLATGYLQLSGHADPAADVYEATQHYNDPRNAGARGRIAEMVRADGGWRYALPGERPDVAWFLGSVMPGRTHQEVEMMRGGCLSGDWRPVHELNGGVDTLGPCLVGRGGLNRGMDEEFWQIIEGGYNVKRNDQGLVIVAQAAILMKPIEVITAKATKMQVNVPANMSAEEAQKALDAAAKGGCDGSCQNHDHGSQGVQANAGLDKVLERLDTIEDGIRANSVRLRAVSNRV